MFLGRDRGFLGHDRGFSSLNSVVFILILCRDRGPPCVAMVFCFLSRQRSLCRNPDGHDKRSRLRRSLVKAKRFHVTIEICSVETGFHGVMSRQGILCRDRV